ncbi:MAG: DUF2339 domain-containing protein [Burkholderiales bacterium]
MWFIGLLAGAILGGWVEGGEGIFVGGALGMLAGFACRHALRAPKELEERIAVLEKAVAELRHTKVRIPADAAPTAAAGLTPAVSPATAGVPPASTSMPIEASSPAPTAESAATASEIPDLPRPPEPSIELPESGPGWFDKAWNWLTGGNALVRVGVVVLFFGVAFLLKYAYDHTQLPVELRIVGVAIGAAIMLGIGWHLRYSKPVYGLALQGGGVGLLYLTVFGAFRIFHLIPSEAAFGFLVAIAVFSAILAVAQNTMSLAVLGVSGGFLAPVLASTGGGSHVALFSYYAVLNAGVLGIAFYKAWRPLNLVGFVFTFGIGAIWGAKFYRPEFFSGTEPFLIIFFLQYVAIAVMFAFRQAPSLRHYVDSTIVFGTPLVAFGLQSRLVQGIEYGAAWSAVGAAAVYLVLAMLLARRHVDSLRMLVEAFLALGVLFATLAIPLAFDARWTSAAWALEGAAAYWVGVRQGRRAPRVFGLLLQLASGAAFVADWQRQTGELPILNSIFIGGVLIAGAALFSNRTAERHFATAGPLAMQIARGVFYWGLVWWIFTGVHEIDVHVPVGERFNALLLFGAGTCSAFSIGWGRGWFIARQPALALAPFMALLLGATLISDEVAHPLAGYGLAAWPIALLFHFRILRRHPPEDVPRADLLHAIGVWFVVLVATWEAGWQIDRLIEGSRIWPLATWGAVPAILLALLIARGGQFAWPVIAHPRGYYWFGAGPVAAALLLWSLFANFSHNGDPAPLPYLPFLNPLDIVQGIAFLIVFNWWQRLDGWGIDAHEQVPPLIARAALGGAAFVYINGVLLRTLHHWAEIPWRLDDMMRADLVQASLSVFWTVLALMAMLTAYRRGMRALWLAGAGLMAIVVAKLFLLDFAKIGGVERIVTFIGVGILMLVIGYFAPLPPKKTEAS